MRKRHQLGSLQVKKQGGHKKWILQYWDGPRKKHHTIGLVSQVTKGEAQKAQSEIMSQVNAREAPNPQTTFNAFLEGVALPFYRSKWKASTASTTENRMTYHLDFDMPLRDISLKTLQGFLHAKASTLSKSMVAHLRWDLRAVFKLALAEGYVQRDPTAALYTPKEASVKQTRAMTGKEVEQYLAALDPRERLIAHLAIFSGIRPGELLGLQRRHVAADCKAVTIGQRVYRGDIDTPKTNSSIRTAAIPPKSAVLLKAWMDIVGEKPRAWVFASEKREKPMWRDNVWYRYMKPKLELIGLEWANFQALRRTHASLGHEAGIDPKVSADQRGHGIGVALDVYTKTALNKKADAAATLENSVFAA